MSDSPRPTPTFVQLVSDLPLDEQSRVDLFDAATSRLQGLRSSLESFAVAHDPTLPNAETVCNFLTTMAMLASDAERLYAYAVPRSLLQKSKRPAERKARKHR